MGPFAGLRDSLVWFTILPIAFLIGASLGTQGNILSPVAALLIWIPVSWAIKYYSLIYGYMYGLSLAEVLKGEILKIFREGIVAFAMAMVEGVAATYVRATTPIVFSLV
jgi:PTS system mannose-specific IID component